MLMKAANKAIANALLISILSIVIGYFYIEGIWFSYAFLGPEIGSERETVRFWGTVSIVLGISFIIAVMVWLKNISSLADKMTVILLGLVFLIQIPPVMLWFFNGSLKGTIPHLIVIIAVRVQISFMKKVRNEIQI